jgi:tetratricopeptide (TPR) repeat protein
VLQQAFGVPAAEYDAKFRAWALARLARYKGQFLWKERPKPLEEAQKAALAAPSDAAAQVTLASSLLHARKLPEAQKALDAALKLEPDNMPAHFLASKLAGAKKDAAAQEQHLQAIRAAGGDGYQVQMALADLAEGKKDQAAMRAAFEAAHRFDPKQAEPLKGLFDLAKEQHREADELDLLKKLAPLAQHDRKVWRMLLQRLVTAKRWDEAKQVGESTLFVDVETASTHVLYAKALGALKEHDKAMFELESALACEAKPKETAAVHAAIAAEQLAVKNVAAARKAREEALRVDPENAEAKGLVIP